MTKFQFSILVLGIQLILVSMFPGKIILLCIFMFTLGMFTTHQLYKLWNMYIEHCVHTVINKDPEATTKQLREILDKLMEVKCNKKN